MLKKGDIAPDVTAPMATPGAAETAERGSYTGSDVSKFSRDREVTYTWANQESGVYPEVTELEAAVRDAR